EDRAYVHLTGSSASDAERLEDRASNASAEDSGDRIPYGSEALLLHHRACSVAAERAAHETDDQVHDVHRSPPGGNPAHIAIVERAVFSACYLCPIFSELASHSPRQRRKLSFCRKLDSELFGIG